MHLPFLVSAQHNFFSYLWGGELRNERTWFWWAAPRYNSCLAAHGSLFFSIEGKEGGNRLWINRRLIVPWLTGVCWSWDSVDETWIPFPSCVSSPVLQPGLINGCFISMELSFFLYSRSRLKMKPTCHLMVVSRRGSQQRKDNNVASPKRQSFPVTCWTTCKKKEKRNRRSAHA